MNHSLDDAFDSSDIPSNEFTMDDKKMPNTLTFLICLGFGLCLFYFICLRRTVQSPETWRGREIRERARRHRESQQAMYEKRQQTPEQRLALVEANMRTKRVISQDVEGNWKLGNVSEVASPAKTNPFPGWSGEDEEQICHICLDAFEVGDIVSWSRHSKDCHHVFHADCITPWLEEKRQDECPSCRSDLMVIKKLPSEDDTEKPDVEEGKPESKHQEEGDSMLYVIAHGLISRVAHTAKSYSVITAKDSWESESSKSEADKTDDDLSVPSPFRRVKSHGAALPSKNRRPSVTSLGSSFRNLWRRNVAHADDEKTVTPSNPNLSEPLPFVRSQSEMTTSTGRIDMAGRALFPPTVRRASAQNLRSQPPSSADLSQASNDEESLDWLVPQGAGDESELEEEQPSTNDDGPDENDCPDEEIGMEL